MKRDHVSPTIFSSSFLVLRDQVMGWLRKYLVRFTLLNELVGTLRKLGRNPDPDVARDCKVHDQLWLKDAHDRYHDRTFSAQHPVDHSRHVPLVKFPKIIARPLSESSQLPMPVCRSRDSRWTSVARSEPKPAPQQRDPLVDPFGGPQDDRGSGNCPREGGTSRDPGACQAKLDGVCFSYRAHRSL